MSLLAASWLLTTAGLRNRVRRFTRRLQQPKYILATVAAAAYLYLLVFRRLGAGPLSLQRTGGSGLPPEALIGVELLLILLVLASVAMTWLLGRDDAVLTFTEAEIQLLFPAPLSRRSLVLFKLNRSLLRTLLSAVLSTVLIGRNFTGHPVLFTLGFWMGINTLMLHGTAAGFARQSLAEHGLSGLRRRLVTVLAFAAVVGAIGYWAARAVPPPPGGLDPDRLSEYAQALLHSAPLRYVLWPVRALTQLVLAQDVASFLARLPAALLVFGVHYAWAVYSNGAFEEASVEAAETRAKERERRRRAPFQRAAKGTTKSARLSAVGPPALGLAWKNVLGLKRSLGIRMLPLVLSLGFLAFALVKGVAGPNGGTVRALVGGGALIFAALTAVMGPLWARFDFRTDLRHMEALRALPLSGRQAAFGQLAGPAAVLALTQWGLLAVGVALGGPVLATQVPPALQLAAVGAAALVGPCISTAGLVLHNGMALLFPDWVQSSGAGNRGVEVLGQRLISLFGTLVALGLTLLPAALVGGVAALALSAALGAGAAAALVGGALAAGVMAVELFFGLTLLGRLYDRFDLSL